MDAQYYQEKDGIMYCKPCAGMFNFAIAQYFPADFKRGGSIAVFFNYFQKKIIFYKVRKINQFDKHTWFYNSQTDIFNEFKGIYSINTIARNINFLENKGILISRYIAKELKYKKLKSNAKFYSMDNDFLTKETGEVLKNMGFKSPTFQEKKVVDTEAPIEELSPPLKVGEEELSPPLKVGDEDKKTPQKEGQKNTIVSPAEGGSTPPLKVGDDFANSSLSPAEKEPFSGTHTVTGYGNCLLCKQEKKIFPVFLSECENDPFCKMSEEALPLPSSYTGPRLPDSPNLAISQNGKYKLILPTYKTILETDVVQKILEAEITNSYLDLMSRKKLDVFLETYLEGRELEALTFFWTEMFKDLDVSEILKTEKKFTEETLVQGFKRDIAKHFPWGATWVNSYQTEYDGKGLDEYLADLKNGTKAVKGYGDKSIDRLDQLIRKAFNKPSGFKWGEPVADGRKALGLMVKMINKKGEYDFWGRIRKLAEDKFYGKNITKLTALYYKARSAAQESDENEAILYTTAIGAVKVDDYGFLVEKSTEKSKRLKKYKLEDILYADPDDKESSDEYVRKGNLVLSKWADPMGLKKLQTIMEKEGIRIHYPFRSAEIPKIIENKI